MCLLLMRQSPGRTEGLLTLLSLSSLVRQSPGRAEGLLTLLSLSSLVRQSPGRTEGPGNTAASR